MEYKETGGGRVGLLNATWPMVDLNVSKDNLTIDGQVVGRMEFKKSDVISIDPEFALIGSGIRIVHKRRDIDKIVIFWTKNSSGKLLSSIRGVGFIPDKSELTQYEKELILERDKFPLKLKILIPYIALVVVSILLDFEFLPDNKSHYSIIGSLTSFLIINFLIQASKSFRKLILVEGKTKDDIAYVSLLLIFATMYNLIVYAINSSF